MVVVNMVVVDIKMPSSNLAAIPSTYSLSLSYPTNTYRFDCSKHLSLTPTVVLTYLDPISFRKSTSPGLPVSHVRRLRLCHRPSHVLYPLLLGMRWPHRQQRTRRQYCNPQPSASTHNVQYQGTGDHFTPPIESGDEIIAKHDQIQVSIPRRLDHPKDSSWHNLSSARAAGLQSQSSVYSSSDMCV